MELGRGHFCSGGQGVAERLLVAMQRRRESQKNIMLACAPVLRLECVDAYRPSSYEIIVEKEGASCSFLAEAVPSRAQDFAQLVIKVLKERYNLNGVAAYPLSVVGKQAHALTIFFVVPVENKPSSLQGGVQSMNLQELLDRLDSVTNNRELLFSVDQWLQQRHILSISNSPTCSIDLLFSADGSQSAPGGVVKEVLQNPLNSARLLPPEDSLVISVTNPLFPSS